jgi:hypothetical protein
MPAGGAASSSVLHYASQTTGEIAHRRVRRGTGMAADAQIAAIWPGLLTRWRATSRVQKAARRAFSPTFSITQRDSILWM